VAKRADSDTAPRVGGALCLLVRAPYVLATRGLDVLARGTRGLHVLARSARGLDVLARGARRLHVLTCRTRGLDVIERPRHRRKRRETDDHEPRLRHREDLL